MPRIKKLVRENYSFCLEKSENEFCKVVGTLFIVSPAMRPPEFQSDLCLCMYLLLFKLVKCKSQSVLFDVEELPQPPEYLWRTDVTSSSVILSWNSTTDTVSTVPITEYVVRYRHNDSEDGYMERPTSKLEIKIDGLDAGTAYEFHVLAFNIVGRSRPSKSTVVTTSRATGLSSFYVILAFLNFFLFQSHHCYYFLFYCLLFYFLRTSYF